MYSQEAVEAPEGVATDQAAIQARVSIYPP